MCREIGCNGHLDISIDEDCFAVFAVCDKNKSHKYEKIYFETFDKFYLKEKTIKKCLGCSQVLEGRSIYKCFKCEKIYCSSCFISDKHIQKNLNNLNIIANKCPEDKRELNNFCTNCGEKICIYCLKKKGEKNRHKNHTIKNILDSMPTEYQIKNLQNKVLKKSETFDKIIDSINKWQSELNKKIERLKLNLKNEIKILQKLFLNYNVDFMEYTYYSNFYEFFNSVKDYNNKNLEKFMTSQLFEEKTKNIFDVIFYREPKKKEEDMNMKEIAKLGEDGYVTNFTKDSILLYSNESEEIKLLTYKEDEDNDNYFAVAKIKFYEKISSLNFSDDYRKIYACLSDKKSVKFINYDPDNNTLKLCDDEITLKPVENGEFKKCIYLADNCLATYDDSAVYIWSKKKINSKKFLNTNKSLEEDIYDLIQVNNQYLVFSQFSKLTFMKIKPLSKEKTLKNIDCVDEENSIFIVNNFILVNCDKGIAILSIKTKEFIQYYENWNNWNKKKMVKSLENEIYIFNNVNNVVIKFIFMENCLFPVEEMKIIKHYYNSDNNSIQTDSELNDIEDNIIVNNGNVIFWGETINILTYADEDDEN